MIVNRRITTSAHHLSTPLSFGAPNRPLEVAMIERGRWRHLRSLCGIVQVATFVPACTSWQVQSTAPSDVVAAHPDVLLVTRSDSSRIELRRPEISGDTLYGTGGKDRKAGPRTDGIALADVAHVAVRRP